MNSSPKAQTSASKALSPAIKSLSAATKAQSSTSKSQSSAFKKSSSNKFKIIKAEKTARYLALNTSTGKRSWLYREDLPSKAIINFYQRQFFEQETSTQTGNNLIRIGEKTWAVDNSSQIPNPSKQTQTESFVSNASKQTQTEAFVSKPGVPYIQKYSTDSGLSYQDYRNFVAKNGPFKAHTKSRLNKMIVSTKVKAKAQTSNPTKSSSVEHNLLKRKIEVKARPASPLSTISLTGNSSSEDEADLYDDEAEYDVIRKSEDTNEEESQKEEDLDDEDSDEDDLDDEDREEDDPEEDSDDEKSLESLVRSTKRPKFIIDD